MRLGFDFTGIRAVSLSFDPAEFRGMSVPGITEELLALLRADSPGTSFAVGEVGAAAETIASLAAVVE